MDTDDSLPLDIQDNPTPDAMPGTGITNQSHQDPGTALSFMNIDSQSLVQGSVLMPPSRLTMSCRLTAVLQPRPSKRRIHGVFPGPSLPR